MMKKNYFEAQSKNKILNNKLSYINNFLIFILYIGYEKMITKKIN
ncbi:hypothetical protein SAMN05421846_104252 [Chryseobacterium taeanense]|uniref:Uncharacterized protein n=1 Tax=Chryseobacterium taeanense TaxID=311334 RepID=A0A1G8I915_9FLAO|nr:hypothetical protein SAMN05421846_104252 [Chryseobacterium taeanense]